MCRNCSNWLKNLALKIRPIAKDLSDNVQRKELSAMIAEERAAIQYLINNAGYAKFCSYDDLSVEESINMINLNISAVVALGLYCIPYMKLGSHIINIASQASFQPLPYQNITVLQSFCPQLYTSIECGTEGQTYYGNGGVSGMDRYRSL